MISIKSIVAAAAGVAIFASAQANAGLVYINTYAGNDDQASVNAAIAPDTTTWLAKIDYNDDSNTQSPEDKAISAGLFTLTINADENSGTVDFDLTSVGYILEYVVLKGGPNFALFALDPNAAVGSFTFDLTGFLFVGQGNTPNLSHISFYGDPGSPEIPLPAAAWLMLAGVGGLGFASRKKKAA